MCTIHINSVSRLKRLESKNYEDRYAFGVFRGQLLDEPSLVIKHLFKFTWVNVVGHAKKKVREDTSSLESSTKLVTKTLKLGVTDGHIQSSSLKQSRNVLLRNTELGGGD